MSRFAFLFFTYEVGPIGPTKTKMRLLSEVTGSTIVEFFFLFQISTSASVRVDFCFEALDRGDAEFTFTRSSSNCWSD